MKNTCEQPYSPYFSLQKCAITTSSKFVNSASADLLVLPAYRALLLSLLCLTLCHSCGSPMWMRSVSRFNGLSKLTRYSAPLQVLSSPQGMAAALVRITAQSPFEPSIRVSCTNSCLRRRHVLLGQRISNRIGEQGLVPTTRRFLFYFPLFCRLPFSRVLLCLAPSVSPSLL